MDYSTPRTAFNTMITGFTSPDPSSSRDGTGWHGKAAFQGHTFMHLVYTPAGGTAVDKWYGQTGGAEKTKGKLADYAAIKAGDFWWTTDSGHQNTEQQLKNWANNANTLDDSHGGTTPLVVKHVWQLKAGSNTGATLQALLDPKGSQNPQGHDYSRFGLDVDATGGGCSALAGEAMRAAGFTEQDGWEFKKLCPIVGFDPLFDPNYIPKFSANPLTAAWPDTGDTTNRQLRFYDVAKIVEWIVNNPDVSTAP
jgi:hypothetical protein